MPFTVETKPSSNRCQVFNRESVSRELPLMSNEKYSNVDVPYYNSEESRALASRITLHGSIRDQQIFLLFLSYFSVPQGFVKNEIEIGDTKITHKATKFPSQHKINAAHSSMAGNISDDFFDNLVLRVKELPNEVLKEVVTILSYPQGEFSSFRVFQESMENLLKIDVKEYKKLVSLLFYLYYPSTTYGSSLPPVKFLIDIFTRLLAREESVETILFIDEVRKIFPKISWISPWTYLYHIQNITSHFPIYVNNCVDKELETKFRPTLENLFIRCANGVISFKNGYKIYYEHKKLILENLFFENLSDIERGDTNIFAESIKKLFFFFRELNFLDKQSIYSFWKNNREILYGIKQPVLLLFSELGLGRLIGALAGLKKAIETAIVPPEESECPSSWKYIDKRNFLTRWNEIKEQDNLEIEKISPLMLKLKLLIEQYPKVESSETIFRKYEKFGWIEKELYRVLCLLVPLSEEGLLLGDWINKIKNFRNGLNSPQVVKYIFYYFKTVFPSEYLGEFSAAILEQIEGQLEKLKVAYAAFLERRGGLSYSRVKNFENGWNPQDTKKFLNSTSSRKKLDLIEDVGALFLQHHLALKTMKAVLLSNNQSVVGKIMAERENYESEQNREIFLKLQLMFELWEQMSSQNVTPLLQKMFQLATQIKRVSLLNYGEIVRELDSENRANITSRVYNWLQPSVRIINKRNKSNAASSS